MAGLSPVVHRSVTALLLPLLFVLLCWHGANADRYQDNIFFNYYNASGDLVHIYNLAEKNTYQWDGQCNPQGKYAIVVFGWKISCDKSFVQDLVKNLNEYRGGCVVCMNYDRFAQLSSYARVRRNFKDIKNVLKQKLEFLEEEGFDPDNGYLYGFSFGAQVVLGAAKDYGTRKLHEIDVCDIVGSGFDTSDTNAPNHRVAAKNVQCIHTSRSYGTRHRTSCHQDWILGDCGINQDAASLSPWGSHGVCTLFYNSAFENDFTAGPKPSNCTAEYEARNVPDNFKMGYMETRKLNVRGQLFTPTFAQFPFNVNVTEMQNDEGVAMNATATTAVKIPVSATVGTTTTTVPPTVTKPSPTVATIIEADAETVPTIISTTVTTERSEEESSDESGRSVLWQH